MGENNKHVLKIANLLGVSSEAARQFIAEVQKVSQTPLFWLIAKVVEGMIVDVHDLDPAEVAVRVEPRWTALKAGKSRSRVGQSRRRVTRSRKPRPVRGLGPISGWYE